jgi:hypothetical protein
MSRTKVLLGQAMDTPRPYFIGFECFSKQHQAIQSQLLLILRRDVSNIMSNPNDETSKITNSWLMRLIFHQYVSSVP